MLKIWNDKTKNTLILIFFQNNPEANICSEKFYENLHEKCINLFQYFMRRYFMLREV